MRWPLLLLLLLLLLLPLLLLLRPLLLLRWSLMPLLCLRLCLRLLLRQRSLLRLLPLRRLPLLRWLWSMLGLRQWPLHFRRRLMCGILRMWLLVLVWPLLPRTIGLLCHGRH